MMTPASRIAPIAFVAVMLITTSFHAPVTAADRWIEVKSPHFTVVASTNPGMARTLVWQLEQVRSAVKAVWPWAKVDLDRPLLVLAVGNEEDMRALLPKYWESRNSVRPASVMVSSPDHSLVAIRADLKAEGQSDVNPHATTYFSYVTLILDQSIGVDLPPWLARGVAEMLSNTIVRDSNVLVEYPDSEEPAAHRGARPIACAATHTGEGEGSRPLDPGRVEPLRRAVMGAGAHADVRQGGRPRESLESAVSVARRWHGRREGVCRSARGSRGPRGRLQPVPLEGYLFVRPVECRRIGQEGRIQPARREPLRGGDTAVALVHRDRPAHRSARRICGGAQRRRGR